MLKDFGTRKFQQNIICRAFTVHLPTKGSEKVVSISLILKKSLLRRQREENAFLYISEKRKQTDDSQFKVRSQDLKGRRILAGLTDFLSSKFRI